MHKQKIVQESFRFTSVHRLSNVIRCIIYTSKEMHIEKLVKTFVLLNFENVKEIMKNDHVLVPKNTQTQILQFVSNFLPSHEHPARKPRE